MRLSKAEFLALVLDRSGRHFQQAEDLDEYSWRLDQVVYGRSGRGGEEREGKLLAYLQIAGFVAPKPVFCDGELLLREYVEGVPCDQVHGDEYELLHRLAVMLAQNHEAGRMAPDLVTNPLNMEPSRLVDDGKRQVFWDWTEVVIEEREEGFGRLFAAPFWNEERCRQVLAEYVRCGQKDPDYRLIEIIQQEYRRNQNIYPVVKHPAF